MTIATVVFEAELPFLELQAKSFAVYLDPDCVSELIVLDNTVLGLGSSFKRRLTRLYDHLSGSLRFVRVSALAPTEGVHGWRSQQVAKLMVARQVTTANYVVLDAKNHLIGPVNEETFVGGDGRAHAGMHSYEEHALRTSLRSTLAYLGATEAEISTHMRWFPVTATPFVFDTAVVRQVIDSIEQRSGNPFAAEFERAGLLEFFTYSGWILLHGPGIEAVMDGQPIQSPIVWPRAVSLDGLTEAIDHARRRDAVFFAVHRRALSKADRGFTTALAEWWTSRGLFATSDEAVALIKRFQRNYRPAMAFARLAERTRRRSRMP